MADDQVSRDPRDGAEAQVWLVYQEGAEALGERLPEARAAVEQGFRGSLGETAVLYPGTPRRLVLAGLGPKKLAGPRMVRRAVAEGVRQAAGHGIQHVAVVLPEDCDATRAAYLGAMGAAYRFRWYRSGSEDALPAVTVSLADDRTVDPLVEAAASVTGLARDWVNLGSNDKPPESLAARMRAELPEAVHVTELGHEALRTMGAGGILAVGQGSTHPPVMLAARYQGCPDDPRLLALVGKGITFDSGGLSLKSSEGMMRMKTDMAGAAAVMAAVTALARIGAPVNILAVACLAENMPDGGAQRPGDVIRTLLGKTVEVLNTDAEGRLVLADGVAYAASEGASAIVDIATLTGANAQALGGVRAGYLTADAGLAACLEEAAEATGEAVWPMPMDDEFRQAIKSPMADLKNIGGRTGGMQVGGLFIEAFTQGRPWLHVDMAGLSYQEEPRNGLQAGATGYGVALLSLLAAGWFRRGR